MKHRVWRTVGDGIRPQNSRPARPHRCQTRLIILELIAERTKNLNGQDLPVKQACATFDIPFEEYWKVKS